MHECFLPEDVLTASSMAAFLPISQVSLVMRLMKTVRSSRGRASRRDTGNIRIRFLKVLATPKFS